MSCQPAVLTFVMLTLQPFAAGGKVGDVILMVVVPEVLVVGETIVVVAGTVPVLGVQTAVNVTLDTTVPPMVFLTVTVTEQVYTWVFEL